MISPPVGERSDKAAPVRQMFASIAPRYDFLNRVLSLGVDRAWRRAAAEEALLLNPGRVLDVATGTADFALELARRAPGSEVVGCDFVPEMLEIGRRKAGKQHMKVTLELGDALNLPYPDATFDALTCAFGFRNFADYPRALSEFWRVLRPGGRLVILEFPPPSRTLFGALFRLYFEQVLPRVGGLISGNPRAYRYLPASVLAFPEPARLADLMVAAGFQTCYRLLSFGIAALHVGNK